MSRILEKTKHFAYAKTKAQISFAVTAFAFAIQIAYS